MASGAVYRQLERVFGGGGVSGLSEGQLLDRFVTRRDDAAFEALVARHGPMVYSVCRRHLRDPNDVDDAFQATFLVLVRKAGSLRRQDLLGNWLYGVAYRVASRARAVAMRRETTGGIDALATATANEAPGPDPDVHDEVRRLPEKYRAPVVLCYLEGLTHEEAADRLRWPVGTVKGRLARARDLLRSRLTRRGVTLASVASALDRLASDAPAALPDRLVVSTTNAAAAAATGKLAVAAVLSGQAVALSEGVIHAMSLTKIKSAAVAVAAAGAVLTGAGVYAYQSGGGAGASPARGRAVLNPPPPPTTTTVTETVSPNAAARRETPSPTDLTSFNALLDQLQAGKPVGVHLVANTSEAIAQKDLAVATDPAQRVAAIRRHADRMTRLVAATTKSTGEDHQLKIVQAAGALDRAWKQLQSARNGEKVALVGRTPSTIIVPEPPASSSPATGAADPLTSTGGATPSPAAVPASTPAPASNQPKPAPAQPAANAAGGGFGGEGDSGAAAREEESRMRITIGELGPKIATQDKSPRTQYILKKLDEPISMNFANETPLEDIIKYIKAATQGPNDSGIPIYIDPLGLQEAEKTMTSPVTLDLEGVPVKTTLRLMLKQLGLAYCVRDGLIIISSVKGIHQELMEAAGTLPPDQRVGMGMGGLGGGGMYGGGMGGGMR